MLLSIFENFLFKNANTVEDAVMTNREFLLTNKGKQYIRLYYENSATINSSTIFVCYFCYTMIFILNIRSFILEILL